MSGMEIFLFLLMCICLPSAFFAAVRPKKQNMYIFPAAMWTLCAAMNLPSHRPATLVIGGLQVLAAIAFTIGYMRSRHDPSVS